MAKLRIAVITSYFPNSEEPYRGHSTFQTLLCMRHQADIHVFSPLPRYPAVKWLEPVHYRYRRLEHPQPPAEFDAQYFFYPALRLLSRPFHGWFAARRMRTAVVQYNPDVILNYWLYPDGYAAVKLGARLGKPVVVGSIGSDLRRIEDPFTRRFTRQVLRSASAVITVSDELRTRAVDLGAAPASCLTVRNGCDTSVFQVANRGTARRELGLSEQVRLILFVGNLVATKGVRELAQAFEGLAADMTGLQCVLIGEGPLWDELRAVELRTKGAFQMLGRATSAVVARWLAAADVFCLPSYSEGSPNAIIEALASGRPVVGTNVGGVPELVPEDCGVLVSPRDVAGLSRALRHTLTAEWHPDRIAARRSRSWDDSARETLEICRRAAERRVEAP